ncbi:hypothetical protein Tco_1508202 [Tanacetum coccineum]
MSISNTKVYNDKEEDTSSKLSKIPTDKISVRLKTNSRRRKVKGEKITRSYRSASEEDSRSSNSSEEDKDHAEKLYFYSLQILPRKLYKPTNNNLRTSATPETRMWILIQVQDDNQTWTVLNQRILSLSKVMHNQNGLKTLRINKENILLCKQAEKSGKGFDSNVTPDKRICVIDDIQDDQNDVECDEEQIVEQALVKHSNDLFISSYPTAQDMEILIKTCLIPLALKTQNDSFAFVQELKHEMHADLKECDCLAQKLSEQTEFVSKEIYTELLRSFAKLEKHSISLEIALQQCQEQLKNDTICKEKASNVFQKEREQYFEIQDLKAQLQDKNIAISELKKLIEKLKGKSVDTKFDRPSVVRQPNAQRIPKPSVLGKPTPFSDSLERTNFPKKKSV